MSLEQSDAEAAAVSTAVRAAAFALRDRLSEHERCVVSG